jgi:dGTPase
LDIEDGVRLGHVTHEQARKLFGKAAVLSGREAKRASVERLRGLAIHQLVRSVANTFKQNESDIMNGVEDVSLTDNNPTLGELKTLAVKHCYRAAEVLELEMAGREAIRDLLAHFVGAVAALDAPESTAFKLLKARRVQLETTGTAYDRVLRVTDYVSGMTDGYALETYRRLSGINLGSRAA